MIAGSSHGINNLTVGACTANPDPEYAGSFYFVEALSATQFNITSGYNDSTCSSGSAEGFVLTIGECFVNGTVSWVLATDFCQGGFTPNTAGANSVTVIQTYNNAICQFNNYESVGNLVTDGSCNQLGDYYYNVTDVSAAYVAFNWGCSAGCVACMTVDSVIPFGFCSVNPQITLGTGSVQFVLTSTLATCASTTATTTTSTTAETNTTTTTTIPTTTGNYTTTTTTTPTTTETNTTTTTTTPFTAPSNIYLYSFPSPSGTGSDRYNFLK